MNEGNQNRRETCASALREGFETNIHMIEKTVLQDERDFILEVPISIFGTIMYMVKERNQISLIKFYLVRRTRFPKKVMVKAIVDICKELFPAIEKSVKRNDWIFYQDGGPCP